MKITILHKFAKAPKDAYVVDTTSKSPDSWQRDLSPFHLGPCKLYYKFVARKMENGWQFSKVYKEHVRHGEILPDYWEWAKKGWNDEWAHRYPMGKGKKPLFSLWKGDRLGYIEARKRIYVPLYANAVVKTKGWEQLNAVCSENKHVVLRDWDGYDHNSLGMTLTQVLNCETRKMGHAFVLKMLLIESKALKQCEWEEL